MERILTLKEEIGKFFFEKHLDFLTSVPQQRIQEIILSSCTRGNSGKLTDFADVFPVHRTTYGHFLSKGKWDEEKMQKYINPRVFKPSRSWQNLRRHLSSSALTIQLYRKRNRLPKRNGLQREPAGITLIWRERWSTVIRFMPQSSVPETLPCVILSNATTKKMPQRSI